MSNDINIYNGVNYEFIEIIDGFQVVFVTSTRESFKLALKCNSNWIGSVVLYGTLNTVYTEENEISEQYATDSWIDIKPAYNGSIVCFEHGLASSAALCKFDDTNPFIDASYDFLNGSYQLNAGIALFVISGSISINGTALGDKIYISSSDVDRSITCDNAHVFLIDKNNVFLQN